jgi:predicted dehydrogenase
MTDRYSRATRRQFLWLAVTAAGTVHRLAAGGSGAPAAIAGPAVRCAVVGVGFRGREILERLTAWEGAEIKAYCDVYPPYLTRAGRLAPEARGYEDFREMLGDIDDLEAVFVATPTHLHREIAIELLSAGKHVYCEAPMASTIEDCRAIARAAAGSDAVFAVGLQNRANPVYQHAYQFLRARAAGSPVTDKGHWFENNSWRRPVGQSEFEEFLNWRLNSEVSLGLLGEAGVHSFDNTLRHRTDLPVSVTSFGSISKWHDGRTVEDVVTCVVEYEDGFLSRFEASLANSFRQKYYLVNGTEGSFLLQDSRAWWFKEADAPSLGWEVYASREKIGDEEGIVLLADATQLLERGFIPGEHQNDLEGDLEDDPLRIAIEDFFRSIREGSAPAAGNREGLQSAVLAIRAHESLRRRQRLEIAPDLFEI